MPEIFAYQAYPTSSSSNNTNHNDNNSLRLKPAPSMLCDRVFSPHAIESKSGRITPTSPAQKIATGKIDPTRHKENPKKRKKKLPSSDEDDTNEEEADEKGKFFSTKFEDYAPVRSLRSRASMWKSLSSRCFQFSLLSLRSFSSFTIDLITSPSSFDLLSFLIRSTFVVSGLSSSDLVESVTHYQDEDEESEYGQSHVIFCVHI